MGFCDQTLSVDIDAEELCKTVALVPSVGKKTNYFYKILGVLGFYADRRGPRTYAEVRVLS